MHPLVGDDPAVSSLLGLLGHGPWRCGAPEILQEAQSRMHLVLGEVLYQDAQAFSLGHGSILESLAFSDNADFRDTVSEIKGLAGGEAF
jgi:hypothetical protein